MLMLINRTSKPCYDWWPTSCRVCVCLQEELTTWYLAVWGRSLAAPSVWSLRSLTQWLCPCMWWDSLRHWWLCSRWVTTVCVCVCPLCVESRRSVKDFLVSFFVYFKQLQLKVSRFCYSTNYNSIAKRSRSPLVQLDYLGKHRIDTRFIFNEKKMHKNVLLMS